MVYQRARQQLLALWHSECQRSRTRRQSCQGKVFGGGSLIPILAGDGLDLVFWQTVFQTQKVLEDLFL